MGTSQDEDEAERTGQVGPPSSPSNPTPCPFHSPAPDQRHGPARALVREHALSLVQPHSSARALATSFEIRSSPLPVPPSLQQAPGPHACSLALRLHSSGLCSHHHLRHFHSSSLFCCHRALALTVAATTRCVYPHDELKPAHLEWGRGGKAQVRLLGR